ncbi:MAG TPA: shikimate kinase [Paludibacteraceae bacterium]|jgi:shikimate kinase|nr:shikimate kinase [Paludibacteraceae bacterium]HOO23672.1 shikimate kinase [Paludibacteraceae bacterium]HRR58642.1 shikimate kinase [Paludibacteraceae bacterium]HRU71865.1 shikimate kinase [Paludibacteraceae bacterium]
MNHIFLVGFMGSGKTSTGKRLAKELKMQHVDLDTFIESRYCKSIQQLFTEKGETEFREIERKALCEVVEYENTVVSTGGGAACFFDNMRLMNEKGLTVFLDSSVETLTNRLKKAKVPRPLLQGKTNEDLRDYIATLLEKRRPFYTAAQLTVTTDNKNFEHVQTIKNAYLNAQKQPL